MALDEIMSELSLLPITAYRIYSKYISSRFILKHEGDNVYNMLERGKDEEKNSE